MIREKWTWREKLEGRYGEHSEYKERPMAEGFVDPRQGPAARPAAVHSPFRLNSMRRCFVP